MGDNDQVVKLRDDWVPFAIGSHDEKGTNAILKLIPPSIRCVSPWCLFLRARADSEFAVKRPSQAAKATTKKQLQDCYKTPQQ